MNGGGRGRWGGGGKLGGVWGEIGCEGEGFLRCSLDN